MHIYTDISIHAPRVGRDGNIVITCAAVVTFQSTRPVWGATVGDVNGFHALDISIHAPRVGRDHVDGDGSGGAKVISIHAPRVGRDPMRLMRPLMRLLFQSTRPVWGATIDINYKEENT